jgi:hypothetical protein
VAGLRLAQITAITRPPIAAMPSSTAAVFIISASAVSLLRKEPLDCRLYLTPRSRRRAASSGDQGG